MRAVEPRTSRGQATRAALIKGARHVFERDGFLDARVVDIAREAGTALGSFYTYFENKEEIFSAVVEELERDEMLRPPSLAYLTSEDEDPVELIARNHRAYLEAYLRNAKLMRVMEEVTNISEGFRHRRTTRAQPTVKANTEAIRELQRAGRVDPALDPLRTARALSGMVSRDAYITFVLEEETSIDGLAETLTRLWVNALKLRVDERSLERLGQ